jgi:hypothetical protein
VGTAPRTRRIGRLVSEERKYSPDEANAALLQVVPLLEQLRDAQQTLSKLHDEVLEAASGNGGGGPGREYLEASNQAAAAVKELEGMGIQVRDPETGLIDFPAERDGQTVFLCFRLGEDRVAWWHPPETGFAGRQPL